MWLNPRAHGAGDSIPNAQTLDPHHTPRFEAPRGRVCTGADASCSRTHDQRKTTPHRVAARGQQLHRGQLANARTPRTEHEGLTCTREAQQTGDEETGYRHLFKSPYVRHHIGQEASTH